MNGNYGYGNQQIPGWVQKLQRFMMGRNGPDTLGNDCLKLYFVLLVINLFARNGILSILMLLLIVYSVFRMLSRHVSARHAENMWYWNHRERVKNWFGNIGWLHSFGNFCATKWKRLKKLPTKAYRHCPSCRAELCLPRKHGRHGVRCPRCGKDFSIYIL